jgi:hypothetical protein
MLVSVAAIAAVWLSFSAALAQGCRIALSLALDVSSSVDAREYTLQIEGLARALEDPAVRAALMLVPEAPVALQVFEWSGEHHQEVIVDWAFVRTPADTDRIAEALRGHQRSVSDGQTALGEALDFGYRQFDRAPLCAVYKIDVSGDGQSNVGILPQDLYWNGPFNPVTVNGLAIEASVAALSLYFRNFVIRGPGAFVMQVASFEDYAEAIRDKLLRELLSEQLVQLTDD